MPVNLQVDQALGATAQPVKDRNDNASPLLLSTDAVGIGATAPGSVLHVAVGTSQDEQAALRVSGTFPSLNLYGDSGNPEDRNWAIAAPWFHHGDFSILQSTAQGGDPRNAGTARFHISPAGNIGIGTTSPGATVEIVGAAPADANDAQLRIAAPAGNFMLVGRATDYGFVQSHNREPLALNPLGNNVGIGTASPTETLEVNGSILATGDVRVGGADCAEAFDVEDAHELEPGTVMVIGDDETLRRSTEPYDTRVAGVISGAGECTPGIVLGEKRPRHGRMPVALTGKVYCKVDAGYAPIAVGDLLTTSPSPGHAMKAGDPLRAFGAVIGKALRPLTEGTGLIPVLVALQ